MAKIHSKYTVTHYLECGTCSKRVPVIIHLEVDDSTTNEENKIMINAAITSIDTSSTVDHQFMHIVEQEFE